VHPIHLAGAAVVFDGRAGAIRSNRGHVGSILSVPDDNGIDVDLQAECGGIDIYLFDQLLRGRIRPGDRVFDAGCGFGRNLVYLLRSGVDVFAADADADAVEAVRALAARLAPDLPAANFRAEPLDRLSFPDGFATVVISSAVLHFARTDEAFDAMLEGSWRALAPGGLFFCRLASSIGIEGLVRPLGAGRRHLLPDGTERYLVDEAFLVDRTARLGGVLLDPIKTTVVQGQRSMTTWVVRKGG
jgi:SAM-dependent methyltransferase